MLVDWPHRSGYAATSVGIWGHWNHSEMKKEMTAKQALLLGIAALCTSSHQCLAAQTALQPRLVQTWGIRGLLASGTLGITPGYHGYMTKKRLIQDAWLPPSKFAREALVSARVEIADAGGTY